MVASSQTATSVAAPFNKSVCGLLTHHVCSLRSGLFPDAGPHGGEFLASSACRRHRQAECVGLPSSRPADLLASSFIVHADHPVPCARKLFGQRPHPIKQRGLRHWLPMAPVLVRDRPSALRQQPRRRGPEEGRMAGSFALIQPRRSFRWRIKRIATARPMPSSAPISSRQTVWQDARRRFERSSVSNGVFTYSTVALINATCASSGLVTR